MCSTAFFGKTVPFRPVLKVREEPTAYTDFRYSWLGSLPILAGMLWVLGETARKGLQLQSLLRSLLQL